MEPEEELPQPRRHRDLPRGQRMRLDLGVAALLLGAVAAVAIAFAHHDGSGTRAAGPLSTTATPGPSVATDFVTVTPEPGGGWLPRAPRPIAHCPVATECVTTTTIPDPVRAALQDAFPGARLTAGRMVRLYVRSYGDALIAFDVVAQRGAERITVHLRGAARTDIGRDAGRQTGSVIVGGRRIVSYETTLAQYDVFVQVAAPAADHVGIAPLAQLAGDARLLARF